MELSQNTITKLLGTWIFFVAVLFCLGAVALVTAETENTNPTEDLSVSSNLNRYYVSLTQQHAEINSCLGDYNKDDVVTSQDFSVFSLFNLNYEEDFLLPSSLLQLDIVQTDTVIYEWNDLDRVIFEQNYENWITKESCMYFRTNSLP